MPVARATALVKDGGKYYFSWVDEETMVYHSVDLNLDQVAVLLKQAADIINGCYIIAKDTE
jgi:hypothetical protein